MRILLKAVNRGVFDSNLPKTRVLIVKNSWSPSLRFQDSDSETCLDLPDLQFNCLSRSICNVDHARLFKANLQDRIEYAEMKQLGRLRALICNFCHCTCGKADVALQWEGITFFGLGNTYILYSGLLQHVFTYTAPRSLS